MRPPDAKSAALAPHTHAHHVRLTILRAPDASVTLRSLRHAHGHDAGVACAEGALADRGEVARKSPTTPCLLDPAVPRASAPPLYTQVDHWSCSFALRSPPTIISMRPRGGGPWGRGALLRQNRQPRLRCAPRVCPGRLHSGSASTQTLGHAPIAPELEIAILTPAAPMLILKVTFSFETGIANRRNQLCCMV